jgi:predicted membrane-bound spermidine synthase
MRKFFLEIIVFICGAVVMAFEIIGSRMLGPYVGTSIFVWTGIIGVILLCLSLGYYYGGKIADKKPDFKLLAMIILFAGLFIGISTLIKDGLFSMLLNVFSNVKLISLLASFILFSIPSVLLGMVSPFAARLKIKTLDKSGSAVGNLYAISTLGSITGTFLAGFYLIPSFGVTSILYLLAIILVLSALLLYFIYRNNTQTQIT